jgi:hypothetical protein
MNAGHQRGRPALRGGGRRDRQCPAAPLSARPPKKPFYDAFIMSASEDALDGLCDSMAKLVEAVAKAMVVCWNARAADP